MIGESGDKIIAESKTQLTLHGFPSWSDRTFAVYILHKGPSHMLHNMWAPETLTIVCTNIITKTWLYNFDLPPKPHFYIVKRVAGVYIIFLGPVVQN